MVAAAGSAKDSVPPAKFFMPAKPQKQTRDAEATKAAFLRAGKILFARHGFAGVTMDMLAAEANANKALVSYYFGSKDGLHDAVIGKLVSGVVADVSAQAKETSDPEKDFRVYVRALSRALGARPAFPAILLRGYLNGSMQAREQPFKDVIELFRMTRRHYEAGYRAKCFRKLDPHLLHLSIVGPLSHFIVAAEARRKSAAFLKGEVSDPDLAAFTAHHEKMILAGLRRNAA